MLVALYLLSDQPEQYRQLLLLQTVHPPSHITVNLRYLRVSNASPQHYVLVQNDELATQQLPLLVNALLLNNCPTVLGDDGLELFETVDLDDLQTELGLLALEKRLSLLLRPQLPPHHLLYPQQVLLRYADLAPTVLLVPAKNKGDLASNKTALSE